MVNIPYTMEWKQCFFDNRYEVSNYGKIRRKKCNGEYVEIKGSILNKNKSHPYYYIQIQKNGKRKNYLIHRIVATHFCDGQDEINNIVDHIDRNTLNNYSSNLRWGTQKDNMNNLAFNHTDETRKEYTRNYNKNVRSQKVTCICGSEVAKYNLSAHMKSAKHSKALCETNN